jgi:hypothetical protein
MTNTDSNGIKKQYGHITCDKVINEIENAKTAVAVLRQVVTSTYPNVRPGSSKSSALFSAEDFGGEEQSYEQQRTALVKVPLQATKEQVEAKLRQLENPCIYRVMSYNVEDVLTEEQISAINQGISNKTFDDYKESLTAVYPEGDEKAGQKILRNGMSFFRNTFFSDTAKADIDHTVEQFAAMQQEASIARRREELTEEQQEFFQGAAVQQEKDF